MKKAVLFLLLTLVLIPSVRAEETAPPAENPNAVVDVTLTDDTTPSIVLGTPEPAPQVEGAGTAVVAAPSVDVSAVEAAPYASGSSALAEARQLAAAGDHAQAKKVLEPVLSSLADSELDEANDLLAQANYKILFETTEEFPGITAHKVKPGESLYVIAKKYKTTPDFIALINHLKGTVIFPEQNLRIVTNPFSVRVSKEKNRLELYLGDEIIRTYSVATGTDNSTPVGSFTITTKLENPTWYKTGAVVPPSSKENILGTRWLGFSVVGYGIHGTTIPESIGTQSTAGCVRMRNNEVEELYALVPMGTVVTIVN